MEAGHISRAGRGGSLSLDCLSPASVIYLFVLTSEHAHILLHLLRISITFTSIHSVLCFVISSFNHNVIREL